VTFVRLPRPSAPGTHPATSPRTRWRGRRHGRTNPTIHGGALTLLCSLLGGALLGLLAADVFSTIFHPGGRGGPVNRTQNRLVWRFFRAVGERLDGTRRARWLSYGGPALVVVTLLVWVLWLVGAFALVYFPHVADFLVSPGSLRLPWAEALYYSGYTAATLGLGDVVADREALRLLTVVQALSGFALVGVSTTYLLAVYRELLAMQSLASNVDGYFRAVEVEREIEAGGRGADAVARWTEGVTAKLLHVLEAHFQYPILHYFRAGEASRSLPVQLGHLVELRRWTREASAAGRAHPSLASLADAVEVYLSEVEANFIPGTAELGDLTEGDETAGAHRRLLHTMGY
jgi:hypothetical protein